ncbi:hypothetical protein [Dactylosporangium sp. CA-092794]|uniref:hypothetical protein n=1 Tax=Dactylosporangium sp. CA-092794 TaxID=3239929 RepID=UPI003D8CF4A0
MTWRTAAAATAGGLALGAVSLLLNGPPHGSAGSAAGTQGRAVSGVALVNDATRRPILGLTPLTDGTVIDLGRLAGLRLSLRADLAAGAHPGGVTFTMTGAKGDRYTHTDSRAPYFLCDDYADCPPLTTPDTYTLTVRPHTGAPFSVRFTVAAAPAAPPLDVLFVGNSLLGSVNRSSGEDTPALVRRLASAAGRALNVTEVIHSGYTLRQTWDDGLVAAALGGARQYDFIVLQEYSTLVAANPAAATETLLGTYAPAFARALKPGGRVVLFKNWALVDPAPFPTRAAATAAIDANYAALSAALATPNLLAPIGDEFETVIAAEGAPYLIEPDGKHPSDAAIYLDAVTLSGIVLSESPRGLADLYLTGPAAADLRAVAATAIGY